VPRKIILVPQVGFLWQCQEACQKCFILRFEMQT
jgi:hypothetical protein